MWDIIKKHFENYSEPITDKQFNFQPNLIDIRTSLNFTLLGFPISVMSYDKGTKKKTELSYFITTSKKFGTTYREEFESKKFFKSVDKLSKQKYLFYILSYSPDTKLSIDNFKSNYVSDCAKMNLGYEILLDNALFLKGTKLDSSKKNMPNFIYGVSSKGKLKTLYRANKKICELKDYWIELKKGN